MPYRSSKAARCRSDTRRDHPADGVVAVDCRERLSKYKLPTRVELVAALSKNALGKFDKPALRAGLAADSR